MDGQVERFTASTRVLLYLPVLAGAALALARGWRQRASRPDARFSSRMALDGRWKEPAMAQTRREWIRGNLLASGALFAPAGRGGRRPV